jgi:ABC-type nickel/cobalt efflux system permease component RcnA
MKSVLILGLLIGMRHAMEADHLAAVAALATRSKGVRDTVLRGAVWGLGHTLTLTLVGGVCLLLNAAVPERVAHALELAVGVMLVGLGAEVLWRMHKRRIHVHVHSHDDGTVHLHAHSHVQEPVEAHEASHHQHPHPRPHPRWQKFSGRALVVGMVHGLAGSAALVLVTLSGVGSFGLGLAYIGLFGLGSILGMATLSVVIALPLQGAARRLTGMVNGLETVIGLGTLGLGLWVIYQMWPV